MALEARNYSATRLYGTDGRPVGYQDDRIQRTRMAQARQAQRSYAAAAPAQEPRRRQEPQHVPTGKPAIKRRVEAEPLTVEQIKRRVGVVAYTAFVGFVLIAAICIWSTVAHAYVKVDTLKKEIDATQKSINDLEYNIENGANVNDRIDGAKGGEYMQPDQSNVAGNQP